MAELRDRDLLRGLREVESAQLPRVTLDGRELLLFCSNNYLGLACHPEVVEAARLATARWGASSVSSRLVSGHMTVHAELEDKIARWKNQEAALVFSTGYQANIGVISSLTGPGDLIVSDQLNHASIIDGARLSKAATVVYRHNDIEDLERVLCENRGAGRVLVVTESVFSMDGDLAPLADISKACRRHGAWLMVDEAHGAGVFGKRGAGLVQELGLESQVQVHMGTLGKALGSFGAYVTGSRTLVDLLVNKARSIIFTTALPPSAAAAALAAIQVVEREPQRAAGLLARATSLALALREAGLEVPNADSQIIPVLLGDAARAVATADKLRAKGFYVAAIRPPTVARGTSRLRVSLMATHTSQEINALRDAIIDCALDDSADTNTAANNGARA
ncbi:MAG TPA: 8-amino-7-oxononanoate synthase [Deltaproteobacteria bacterium]|nr:8-amino-7-oxononanoate synthase [Candidatus Binatota bacterium]HIL14243.1 8-amino-7-oxononanoate synthase [Deltaproteobacteria bacterium]